MKDFDASADALLALNNLSEQSEIVCEGAVGEGGIDETTGDAIVGNETTVTAEWQAIPQTDGADGDEESFSSEQAEEDSLPQAPQA